MTGEDHYPHKDQLTKAQLDKVAELRRRAAATLDLYPGYDTDFSLLRWLMGWDYDIETILPKIQNAIEVQTALGLHNEPSVDITEINDFVKSQSSVSEYFPGGIMGTDRDGNILMMEALARTHPKSLAKTRPVSELFRICASESDAAFKVIRQQEALSGRKLGVKIVIDLDGFNMDLIYTPTLKVYLNLLVLLQAVYPDFARKIYVINCPMMIQTVYALIQPALSKQTREKVSFLGKDWKAKLIEDFGEENIYKHWGGTKEHPNGKPSGDLRMGGKVPEKEWYNADTNPFDIDEGVVKVNVGARGKKEIKVQGKKDKTLRWAFRCSSGDIDFGIYKNGRQVWPKFRVTTEFVPELGQLKLSEDGEYTILFDNSHGKVWSKDIKYRVTVE